jgi:hypothetical protein
MISSNFCGAFGLIGAFKKRNGATERQKLFGALASALGGSGKIIVRRI